MTKKGVVNIHGREYKTVVLRVNEFRKAYKDWAIETEITHFDAGDCVIKATVRNPEGVVKATGIAHEVAGSTKINTTSHIENCETSAIGRCLACLGLGGTEYASADELTVALAQQSQPQPKPSKATKKPKSQGKAEKVDPLKAALTMLWAGVGYNLDEKTITGSVADLNKVMTKINAKFEPDVVKKIGLWEKALRLRMGELEDDQAA